MNLSKLLTNNILTLGKNARGNPQYLEFRHFAAGIANKDYSAQTPWLWNYAYEKLGMDERNVRFFGDPANTEVIIEAFRQDKLYIGGDVGVGFKDKAWKLVDEIDALAKVMQSINVIVKHQGKLVGHNTDGQGYADSLIELMREQDETLPKAWPLHGKNIMMLGGGGTASSIAVALAAKGAKLIILNRTVEKALSLAKRINHHFHMYLAAGGGREVIAKYLSKVDAVVTAIDEPDSPLYQYSALGSIKLPATIEHVAQNLGEAHELMARMRSRAIISDVMLRDEDTVTIREAKKAGFLTLDGRPMVRNQAIEAFWLVNQDRLEKLGVSYEQVAGLIREASQS